MQEFTTTLNGIEVVAEYKVYGKHLSATRYDPEEFAEVVLLALWVVALDIDIIDSISDSQKNEILDAIENEIF